MPKKASTPQQEANASKPAAPASKPKPKPKAQTKPRSKPKPKQPAQPKQPRGRGRPTSCTPAIRDEICTRLAEGQSLRKICLADHLPAVGTVVSWVASSDPAYKDFQEQYARARRAQAELMADEIKDISDDDADDWTEDSEGKIRLNRQAIERSRLRVDSRKWVAVKLLPKVYGDRLDLNMQNDPVTEKSDEELDNDIAKLLAAGNGKPPSI